MIATNSPVDAIAPAVEHVRRVLFRPFDLGKWFTLGFLTFLNMLPEVFNEGRAGFNLSSRRERWGDGARMANRLAQWVSENVALVSVIGFVAILVFLVVVVIFLWLSSRATFCYLDSIARNRAEVVRPWREHGDLADSYFFWRLLFGVAVAVSALLLLAPVLYSLWKMASSGQEVTPWSFFFGSGLVIVSLPLLLIGIAALVVRVLLADFVAPVQYQRRAACSAAFHTVWGLVRAHPVAFILYFVLKIVFAILIAIGTVVFFCLTCCVACCLALIPIVGQTLLQPIYVFSRSFPLFFLRGYGPEFDVFAPGVLGWGGPLPPPDAPPAPPAPAGPPTGPPGGSWGSPAAGPPGGPSGPPSSPPGPSSALEWRPTEASPPDEPPER